jgi:hypothetical protein
MKLFQKVDEYLQEAKENDIVVFGGRGLMDGITNIGSKHDTHKVVKGTTKDKIVVRAFRGRTNLVLSANGYDQQIAVLTKNEFKNLKTLW